MTRRDLSDEELLKQMMQRRDEQRGKPRSAVALSPALEARWHEGFLEGTPQQQMPAATPAGIVVLEYDEVTVYRDGRSQVGVTLPGRPRFGAAARGMDASCRLADVPVAVHFARVEVEPNVALGEQVRSLAAKVAGAPAVPCATGLGVTAATIASRASNDASGVNAIVKVIYMPLTPDASASVDRRRLSGAAGRGAARAAARTTARRTTPPRRR